MTQYQIAVFVGSLRQDSINRKLANAIIKLAPPMFDFDHVKISDLPLYNQDDDPHQAASVLRMKAQIRSAHGILFVTPEYNRSIPGVLKNAIDHASRPHDQNAWDGKPAGILGASPGSMGTALAQQHLRNVLATLNVPAMCTPEAFIHAKEDFFDIAGDINSDSQKFLQKWIAQYVTWIKKHVS